MLDINLVAIGPVKNASYQALIAEYLKRLRPYARVKVNELTATPFSVNTHNQAKASEGQRIEDFLKKARGPVYLLAERGRTFDSPEFAVFLEKNQPLTLVIAGALGFSPELYKNYPQLSLSPLTFPHELARVVLLEQIYRAATILNKKDYHY